MGRSNSFNTNSYCFVCASVRSAERGRGRTDRSNRIVVLAGRRGGLSCSSLDCSPACQATGVEAADGDDGRWRKRKRRGIDIDMKEKNTRSEKNKQRSLVWIPTTFTDRPQRPKLRRELPRELNFPGIVSRKPGSPTQLRLRWIFLRLSAPIVSERRQSIMNGFKHLEMERHGRTTGTRGDITACREKWSVIDRPNDSKRVGRFEISRRL